MPDVVDGKALILWRANAPRWSYFTPSGGGAARFGGRWNPIGVPTVYASLEVSTAWTEYNQGFVQHPALIAQLELKGARLADTTNPSVLREWGLDDGIHRTEWRSELNAGVIPSAHAAYHRLVNAGFDGVIYPSFMSPGGGCIALWRWNQGDGPVLVIVDSGGSPD